jgi:hypothetical protein
MGEMTNEERIAHCQAMAAEAFKHAETASFSLARHIFSFQKQWLRLGVQLASEEGAS